MGENQHGIWSWWTSPPRPSFISSPSRKLVVPSSSISALAPDPRSWPTWASSAACARTSPRWQTSSPSTLPRPTLQTEGTSRLERMVVSLVRLTQPHTRVCKTGLVRLSNSRRRQPASWKAAPSWLILWTIVQIMHLLRFQKGFTSSWTGRLSTKEGWGPLITKLRRWRHSWRRENEAFYFKEKQSRISYQISIALK